MKFVVPVVVIALFGYFLFTGMKNIKSSKTASETSTPCKKYLLVTGSIQSVLAALVLITAVFTFKKYGDLDYFFRVIHGFLSPQ